MSKSSMYWEGKTHPLAQYDYSLDEKNVRKDPLSVRDESRLFVYDTKSDTITFDTFNHIAKYLPEESLMVLNDTAVIPARVTFRKDTGGKVGGLVLINEGFDEEGAVPVIVDEKLFVGRKIMLLDTYSFLITRQIDQRFYCKPEFDKELLPGMLLRCGTTPTPFYLGAMTLAEDVLRERYQTIFAQEKKSVAAPTASLHFTSAVFDSLQEKHVETTFVTLDVGLGTFAEVEEKHVENKTLHTEKYHVSSDTLTKLRDAKKTKKPVIAVGTTVTRTLESIASSVDNHEVDDITGETSIFIMPPHAFTMVDHLITNFHVPRSSLMALVDAFLEHKGGKRRILELYNIAQQEGFMFYSFGDSMLIL